MTTLLKNAYIINENQRFEGHLRIDGDRISRIYAKEEKPEKDLPACATIHDLQGKYLLPGLIDDQVHFREPGLTHKGDIRSESRAAVAGGVTSFMDMPNTVPQTLSIDLLEQKYSRAAQCSWANYSFYLGASKHNLAEIQKIDPTKVCGVKLFMGSSTGDMMVDDILSLEKIFAECPTLLAIHSEEEARIRQQTENIRQQYGENPPIRVHPIIRDTEACYRSTLKAVELAQKHHTRLHVLHLSTRKELELFSAGDIKEKQLTNEVCVHHLWFTDQDYDRLGTHIKWNPAIKSPDDRQALRQAVNDNRIDLIATDHAPHTLAEKNHSYFLAPSGGPLIQHSLLLLLDMVKQGVFSLEKVVEKSAHHPATLFRIADRGFIREGYYADLVVVDPKQEYTVNAHNSLYKCGWSPLEGHTFSHRIESTYVNGYRVFHQGEIQEEARGQRLSFQRNPANPHHS